MTDAKENPAPVDGVSPRGFVFALIAYGLWGFLPFFMKAVAHIPSSEVVAHRILWSVPLAGLGGYSYVNGKVAENKLTKGETQ